MQQSFDVRRLLRKFTRPTDEERNELFTNDLGDMGFSATEIKKLVEATSATKTKPAWTYSDIRTRLYPAAVSLAFPNSPLKAEHFHQAVAELEPSPVMAG